MANRDLAQAVYEELRQLADSRLRQERVEHTLQATALVHEVYLRLSDAKEFSNRAEFFSAAAESMRRILIDHARTRKRMKRGGDRQRLSLSQLNLSVEPDPETMLAFDEAMDELALIDERAAHVVRLRFYAGLPSAEIADLLEVSERTVRADWTFARAWLFDRLQIEP